MSYSTVHLIYHSSTGDMEDPRSQGRVPRVVGMVGEVAASVAWHQRIIATTTSLLHFSPRLWKAHVSGHPSRPLDGPISHLRLGRRYLRVLIGLIGASLRLHESGWGRGELSEWEAACVSVRFPFLLSFPSICCLLSLPFPSSIPFSPTTAFCPTILTSPHLTGLTLHSIRFLFLAYSMESMRSISLLDPIYFAALPSSSCLSCNSFCFSAFVPQPRLPQADPTIALPVV